MGQLVVGAEPDSPHMCFLFWQRADSMFIVSSVALATSPPSTTTTTTTTYSLILLVQRDWAEVSTLHRLLHQLVCHRLCNLSAQKTILRVGHAPDTYSCLSLNNSLVARRNSGYSGCRHSFLCWKRLSGCIVANVVCSVTFSLCKWEAQPIHLSSVCPLLSLF